jgi:hypothetical protein
MHVACVCFKHMLQVFYLDIAKVNLEVAYVCNGYTRVSRVSGVYKCFRCMLQVFQLFRTHVASVSSGCCKSTSGVVHVAMVPICCSHLLQLLGRCRGSYCRRLRPPDASAMCIHRRGMVTRTHVVFPHAGAAVRASSNVDSRTQFSRVRVKQSKRDSQGEKQREVHVVGHKNRRHGLLPISMSPTQTRASVQKSGR